MVYVKAVTEHLLLPLSLSSFASLPAVSSPPLGARFFRCEERRKNGGREGGHYSDAEVYDQSPSLQEAIRQFWTPYTSPVFVQPFCCPYIALVIGHWRASPRKSQCLQGQFLWLGFWIWLYFVWFGYCVGGVEGEAGEAVRGQRSEHDLRVQVQNALRRREIHRFLVWSMIRWKMQRSMSPSIVSSGYAFVSIPLPIFAFAMLVYVFLSLLDLFFFTI